MFRIREGILEILLAHPRWTIPEGEIENAGDPLLTTQPEFEEETGFKTTGRFYPLGSVIQKSGKLNADFPLEIMHGLSHTTLIEL